MAGLGLLSLGQLTTANASLQLVQPAPTNPATFVGHGGYSADALGQNGTGGTVQAEVPAGSSVVQAYLYGSYFFNTDPALADRTINFDGTVVVLNKLPHAAPGPCCLLSSARADVTAQVAAKVGSGGGIFDFAVDSDPASLDGVALVVIFSNPALPETTIALLDGGAEQTGDVTTFTFAAPLDKTVPGFSATLSLGIGFSYQATTAHECGSISQSSVVDINGSRLTSCAGSYDDGLGANGALITVGGVGDSLDNPSDPLQQPGDGALPRVNDDELYNIAPFLSQGDTQLVVRTSNPSGDDLLFLAIVSVTARAVVTTEVCDDGVDNDGDGLVDGNDPDCQPQLPDNGPPSCTNVTASLAQLWPPNHQMVPVQLNGATDPDGDPLVTTITGVTQDEAVRERGSGNTAPDAALGAASNEVLLRAERSGSGDGRVYRIAFTVTDPDGASCSSAVVVGVPHDQRPGAVATDSGGNFNSLGS